MSLGGVSVATHPVPHTTESVAYSIEHQRAALVYTGDTGFDHAVARMGGGCDLLLTECSLPDALAIPSHLTPTPGGGHGGDGTLPTVLVLTHFYPPVEAVDIVAEVTEQYDGVVTLATDGWSIDL
jgi:ribonuclease BN (tRNA processing enzyme)